MVAVAGLLLSFLVRRRRVFVRARPAGEAGGEALTVVEVGGLARSDVAGGFEEEFAALTAALRAAHEAAADTGRGPAALARESMTHDDRK